METFQSLMRVLFAASVAVAPEYPSRTEQARHPISSRVEKIFAETKTVCVGCYVLEVPMTSTVVYGPASVPFPIERNPEKVGLSIN